ncbi:hypothetical protein AWC21_01585 [Mycolicibacterium peregrinum]|nr:hypothetical protein AWC21_01585 [Mycolicibacterium peregrinum]
MVPSPWQSGGPITLASDKPEDDAVEQASHLVEPRPHHILMMKSSWTTLLDTIIDGRQLFLKIGYFSF